MVDRGRRASIVDIRRETHQGHLRFPGDRGRDQQAMSVTGNAYDPILCNQGVVGSSPLSRRRFHMPQACFAEGQLGGVHVLRLYSS
jgi:hypothetical protein